MQNVHAQVVESDDPSRPKRALVLTIDLDAATTPSRSGKTRVLASTRGGHAFETPAGKVVVGLNVYQYA